MTGPDPDDVDEELLWYVAYGSNLSAQRLQRYLDRCATTEAPRRRVPMRLDHRLFFADDSTLWTGGVAFLDPTPTPGAATRVVAWLVTIEQFLGIAAMESGRRPGAVTPFAWPMTPGSTRRVLDGRYGLVLACPSPDERPALTVTTPSVPLPPPTLPSIRYVDTIIAGLVAEHGMGDGEARDYLEAHSTP